jgi:hypothetical protein
MAAANHGTRKRRTVLRRAAMLGATLLALSTANPLHAQLPQGAISRADVEKVVADVQRVRALQFKHAVPVSFMTAPAAVSRMQAEAKREKLTDKDAIDSKIAAMLGLIPLGTDIDQIDAKMLLHELGGFYDFHNKDLVVIETPPVPGKRRAPIPVEKRAAALMVLAHELTHALQDQNFDIGATLERARGQDDPTMALRAVIEGDATMSGFAYLSSGMNDQVANLVVSRVPDMYKAFARDTSDIPPGISRGFIFQYFEGVKFVAEAYHRRAWPGVDALYRRPPATSQQILQPALYFDRHFPPPVLRVDGYEDSLKGWKKADDGAFGEIGLRLIIVCGAGQAESLAQAIAGDWNGDYAIAFQNRDKLTIIWVVAFGAESTAASFAAIYRDALDRIHGTRTPHRVSQSGRMVAALVGDAALNSDAMLRDLWLRSTAVGGPPAPPKKGWLEELFGLERPRGFASESAGG